MHFPFNRKIPDGRYVDVRKPKTFVNFRPHEETVFIVHGFNGTARDKHMRYLKDGMKKPLSGCMWISIFYFCFLPLTAYLSRNFNVVLVDWKKLTYYPCYFSALGNTKLVAQCTAQVNILNFIIFSRYASNEIKIMHRIHWHFQCYYVINSHSWWNEESMTKYCRTNWILHKPYMYNVVV